ncbi:hypothetical protein MAPG_11691 [Magnaporthiopsis poae ATCC 64411]|uniref:Uncharacterized protein n=1 Tax=Magnaporthiopsis poae (strain ATCC 64411 / 73-15) TaxID=644358 RepID=A0A0C4EFY1_MAGP6|nr:hypothetical protein MAPG_11691 [Magnaporthiopsis poae ATCC 64411]
MSCSMIRVAFTDTVTTTVPPLAADDFSQFKTPRNLTGKEHYEAYLNLVGRTHGLRVEDDPARYDLWTLYAVRSSLVVSMLWTDHKEMRRDAIKSMRYLTAKYGGA